MALVSVIIPFRNVVEYIDAALDSLACQTYQGFEVILVDDGSTCHYPDFVAERKDCLDIRLLKTGPLGISSARNAGLKTCNGEYVAFLDADDIWIREKLEKQITLLSKALDYDGVYSNAFLIDEDAKFLGKTRASQAGMHQLPEGTVELNWADKIVMSTVLLRKSSIDQTGGFNENLRIAEDWDFFLRKPFRFLCIQKPLILYRRHSRSVGKVVSQSYLDAIQVVESHCARFAHLRKREKAIVTGRIYLNEYSNLLRNRQYLRAITMFFRAICSSPESVLHMVRNAIYTRLSRKKEEESFRSKTAF